ncbi:MAG: sugar MFS transporter [Luteolibacter sp.]
MSNNPSTSGNRFAFSTVTTLFFMWGFITCMNDLLIPKFKADFDLNQFQANMVQFAFFGAYFLVSLLYFLISASKGDPINKIGYKNGLVLGLVISGIGCFMFYPAAEIHQFWLFLAALGVLGAGVTIIQIAANPYVTILGPEESGSSRLNLAQGFCSLGYVIAPFIGGILIFGSDVFKGSEEVGIESLKAPYLGLGAAFIIIAVIFKMITLPSFSQEGKIEPGITAFKHKHFVWGWLAIFFYVGSEVTIGSILVNYLGDPTVANLPENEADKYLSFCWGGLMIGRLMGAISLGDMKESKKLPFMILAAVVSTGIIYACATFKQLLTVGEHIHFMDITPFLGLIVLSFVFFQLGKSSAGKMVGIFALVAAALTIFSMSTTGNYALWSILGIGLFNSIMWSNIFSLSIKGLGKDTSQGSSLLVMMIVGGALMPLGQGFLTDNYGIRASLGIVLFGYLYLIWYGFFAPKAKDTSDDDAPVAAGH